MPDSTSRQIRLVTVPGGPPEPEHFTVTETEVPVAGDGEVLVRNRAFQVFAAMITGLAGAAAPGFPAINPGDPLFGPAVGEVVTAPPDSGLRPGDLVFHQLGWREHAVLPVEQCARPGGDLPDAAAYLSHGWTAYGALTRAVELRTGDTVFVTNAAGAIGSLAGRIAKLLGAGRVIGSTGTPAKAERLIGELGYDAVVLRDAAAPLDEQLAQAAPEGVDVVLDLVGGDQLRAAIRAAGPFARVVLAGGLSAQYAEVNPGTDATVELNLLELISKRIRTVGFKADDHPDAFDEWHERFGTWLRSGEITYPVVRIGGIERSPQALQDVVRGRYTGTVVVEL